MAQPFQDAPWIPTVPNVSQQGAVAEGVGLSYSKNAGYCQHVKDILWVGEQLTINVVKVKDDSSGDSFLIYSFSGNQTMMKNHHRSPGTSFPSRSPFLSYPAYRCRKAAMQLVRKLVEFHPYGPALKGSGDERAKATKLLNEIQESWLDGWMVG